MPRSIMWSTYLNAFLGLIMAITLIFTMGDLDQIAKSPTGYPFMQVFLNATGSRAGTTVMSLLILLPLVGSEIACIATASRQLWSFARDNGVPFAGTVRHVRLSTIICCEHSGNNADQIICCRSTLAGASL